ncbi:laccase precursor [Zalerion maritima]|uniref:Laccase n=1 Tax=Zalerion maritima TaxID=339359 RepID=A0AAD5RLS5_9PEZI|nr:laccase precursor [Zalerion maritima]
MVEEHHEMERMNRHDDAEAGNGNEEVPFLACEDSDHDRRWEPGASAWAATTSRSRRTKCTIFGILLLLWEVAVPISLLRSGAWRSKEGSGGPHHGAVLPSTARLRDESEYTLDSSWDFSAKPSARKYRWTISDAILNPDGVHRPMILINNQFPGPLVRANEGDTIVVHIDNQGINATSIHFHGLFQNGTNDMDGTVGVTGCAIAPNSTHTYEFQVSGQSGTYWYHAHHSAQASDGLLGPVVIHSPGEKESKQGGYASDHVVMVQDHYYNTTAELLMDYLKPGRENDEPVPDTALINGRGKRNCDTVPGWSCDGTGILATLDLEAGKNHRVRIVNVGAFAEFQIEVDEHPFWVTEVDGSDIEPESLHRLNILPAQRYSIVLSANSTTANSFWLRARMITHCFRRDNPNLQPEARAIIRYSHSSAAERETSTPEPSSSPWGEAVDVICRDLNTSSLRPVENLAPPGPTAYVYVRANFMTGAWRLSRGFFNGSTWHGNLTHPSLHRYLDSSRGPNTRSTTAPGYRVNSEVFDSSNDYVVETWGVQTLDVAINNFDDGAHPFHLHGHKFWVMTPSLKGYPPAQAEVSSYLETNGLPTPILRDTVAVAGYEWVIIRVTLDNPGMWAFHCHNSWHAESGMLMQFLVRSEKMSDWKASGDEREMCSRPGVETGVRPDDSIWFGDFGR